MSATLLIIGGSGFFGKSILDAFQRNLLSPWCISKIIVLARSATQLNNTYPDLISGSIELINGDIALIDTIPTADYVIHAAASTDASRYIEQECVEKKNIIQGVLNYCKLAKIHHKKSKIIFCSSGAVYGYQPKGMAYLKESMSFGDHEKLDATKRSYALAKRDSELAIAKLGEYSLNVSIARCFSFVGRFLPKDQHFAIGNFLNNANYKNPIEVKANINVYRSYMYADDLVTWLMTIANSSSSHCPIYNVGSDEVIELHDLAIKISQLFGVDANLTPITDDNVDRYIPSVSKAIDELGLKLSCSLQNALLKSIQ